MEKKFEAPEMEVIRFEEDDIIVSSPLTDGGIDDGQNEIGF